MFRPQRMTAVTLVCPRKHLDVILDVFNEFGEFHIRGTRSEGSKDSQVAFDEAKKVMAKLDSLMERLKIKQEPVSPFKYEKVIRTKLRINDWNLTLQNVSKETSDIVEETAEVLKSLEDID